MRAAPLPNPTQIRRDVRTALREDVGHGDLTAALIPPATRFEATVIVREPAIICGRAWFDEVFRQLNESVVVDWQLADGQACQPDQLICSLSGPARDILTGERSALNFLQLLSGVATRTARLSEMIAHTRTRLLDTRKTIPGLRLAQKYAVLCGGGHNHRIGLFDAILIKENHIAAAGSIAAAVERALQVAEGRMVEVETENLEQLQQAVAAGASRAMLDNYTPQQVTEAVTRYGDQIELEISGGINADSLVRYAECGADFISIGSLTKDIQAIDFSMRFS